MIKSFIKEAITYIFKDKCIIQKSLFLFLLMLLYSYSQIFTFNMFANAGKVSIPFLNYLILSFFTLIVLLLINGYKVSCIKSLIGQSDNLVLPNFNIKTEIKIGVKYTIALLLFFIPLYYFIIGCGFFAGFSNITEHAVFRYIFGIFSVLLVALLIINVLYNFVCLIGFNRIFADTENWFSFVKFKELFSLIKANKKLYFISVLIVFLLSCMSYFVLIGLNILFVRMNIVYLSIIPAALISLYEFYIGVFVASKFKEYPAGQHQLQA